MARSQQQSDTDKAATQAPTAMSKSMHAGVAVWCDCCSCEMEPYWAEVAGEVESPPGDHED